ncbi:glutamate mutase L [Kutzneria sp. 744]|uniref:glutamate mutase L n=1 Tax=Kutzneria sp. (strain 744) TaxID=345341 RepID=UPI0003EEDCD6|nr:glutamate mutase L [Kutzneria sp. 744]EWM15873.1 methylaspartate mutase [Kutzneria sp. 744]
MSTLLCLDIGSTWTKGAMVDERGILVGTAQHPTTAPEVLDGIASVTTRLDAQGLPVLACSSAGGGLRLAVVGQERLVSAEAGYRVALSAGAKIVHVVAGQLNGAAIRELRATRPDLVLLAGGTDGGDRSVLLHNAKRIAANRLKPPIVLAGNADARAEAEALLRETGRTVVATDNVLPDVGELAPGPARAAIRELFLRHVIGGKGLSKGNTFRNLVRAVTPDAVLGGVSRLATILAAREAGAVLVVDVGGATTDVYSAVSTVDENAMQRTVALPPDRRTVEGDLGMRWSAPGIVSEAKVERLDTQTDLEEEAQKRSAAVDWIPEDDHGRDVDATLAGLAATLAVRRHLRLVDGQLGPKGAGLLVLSGGVFRHATPERLHAIEERLRADPVLRPVLRNAEITVDRHYVLAPAGLLADAGRVETADALLANHFSA